jgi:hypothetical protein
MRFCTKWQHSGKKGGKKDTKPGTSKKRFSRLNYDLNTKNKDGLDTKWQHSGKNGGKDFANTVLSNCSTCKTGPARGSPVFIWGACCAAWRSSQTTRVDRAPGRPPQLVEHCASSTAHPTAPYPRG